MTDYRGMDIICLNRIASYDAMNSKDLDELIKAHTK